MKKKSKYRLCLIVLSWMGCLGGLAFPFPGNVSPVLNDPAAPFSEPAEERLLESQYTPLHLLFRKPANAASGFSGEEHAVSGVIRAATLKNVCRYQACSVKKSSLIFVPLRC